MVEPDDNVQVTTNHIDAILPRDSDVYVYKDKGAGFFTDFEHFVDVLCDSAETLSLGYIWALTNELDDIAGLNGASKTSMHVSFYYSIEEGYKLRISETHGGSYYWDDDAYVYSLDTTYYLLISKSGTTFTCKVYSTKADRDGDTGSNLLKTLTMTLQADHSFQYIHGVQTYNSGLDKDLVVDVDNLDLGVAVAYDVTIIDSIGMLDSQVPKWDAHLAVTDKLGLLESQIPKWDAHLTISDKLGLLESTPTAAAFKQAITGVLGLVDSSLNVAAFKQAVTEVLGMLDSQIPKWDAHLTVTDSLGLLDSTPRMAAFKQAITDILGLSDSSPTKAAFKQAITDVLGLSDTVGTAAAFHLAVTDIIGMLDSAARSRCFPITISDILGIRDRLVTRKRRWPLGDLPDDTIQGGA